MNEMPGRSDASNSWHLLEEVGKFLPVKNSVIVNRLNTQFQSLGAYYRSA